MSDVRVEVRGNEIIVSLPGSSYQVTYRKNIVDKSGLRATSRSGRWEKGTPITQAEFYAQAWEAANNKARKLGWIV